MNGLLIQQSMDVQDSPTLQATWSSVGKEPSNDGHSEKKMIPDR